jgi:DNA-binding NarL/FixJ family response regulator
MNKLNSPLVLVIEDEKALRENITEILEFYNLRVIAAPTGEEGVKMAAEFTPDVIVCDIMLPGMDGHEVYGKVKMLQNLSRTSFIFLTAKSTRQDTRAGMDMGADDYLTKPFAKEELISSVRARLEKRSKILEGAIDEEDGSFKTAYEKLSELTKTERKVLKEIAEGLTTRQIAEKFFVSYKTIENHRANISEKLQLQGPNSLISFVFRLKGKNQLDLVI